jgi:hypothetical protein
MPTPIYKTVTSSNINSTAYANGTSYIEFNGGRRFAYSMPRKVYDEMLAAKSIGTYFAKMVKGKYVVTWQGQRCDLMSCPNDATMTGSVAGNRFCLCDDCGKAAMYSTVKLTPLAECK